jgi:fatty acyl-CoA reductase
MAERILKKKRLPHLPTLIVRPSIVGACYRDPMPGWTDTLSALGGLGFAAGLGILNYANTKITRIFDLIPADFVCHNTIVGTALQAGKPTLTVVHASSSDSNPIDI